MGETHQAWERTHVWALEPLMMTFVEFALAQQIKTGQLGLGEK